MSVRPFLSCFSGLSGPSGLSAPAPAPVPAPPVLPARGLSPAVVALSVALSPVLLLAAPAAWADDGSSDDSAAATASATITVTDTSLPIGQPLDAEGFEDYRITHGTTGAKTDIPDRDVPQSVTTVPHRILEEQNAETLNEALRNVAGIQATNSNLQGAGQWVTSRGFQNRNFYKDGLRDDTFDRSYWLGNVERVEVLKGPASVLYGDGSLGGAINVVSAKPLQKTTVSGFVEGGSEGGIGAGSDLSVRLNDQGTALARLIVDQEHQDTFINNYGWNARHAALSFQARVSDQTTVTAGGEFRDRKADGNMSGLPAYARSLGLSDSANFSADWSERQDTGSNLSGRIRHELNEDWAVNSGLLLNHYEFDQSLTSASYTAAQAASNKVTLATNQTTSASDEIVSDTNLDGRVTVAGFDNRLLFGSDQFYGETDRLRRAGSLGSSGTLDIFNPVTGISEPVWTENLHIRYTTRRQGFYAQDLVEITPEVKVMAGIRYDDVDKRQKDLRGKTVTASHDAEWSKRAGATWEFMPGVTAFGGYSHSFVPPGDENTSSLGTLPASDPEQGQQFEGGLKADINDRLTATLATYHMTRENVRTTDTVTNITSIVGEQQSDGVELDATWKIRDGWNLLAAWSWNNARVTRDSKYASGAQLVNAPEYSGRLWSMYEFSEGQLAGVSLGGGLTYVGERAANLTNTYFMPEYVTADLAAGWKIDEHVRLSLNVDNLFNQGYVVASSGDDMPVLYLGEPLSVTGRVQVTF